MSISKNQLKLITSLSQKKYRIKHQLFIYPIKRSLILIYNKKFKYIGYPILTGLFRFLFMINRFLLKNYK